MEDILQNEIKRQEYMETRYKTIEEEMTKPEVDDMFAEKSEREDLEYKVMEELYGNERGKILDELGIIIN
jgi:hypothetical protein